MVQRHGGLRSMLSAPADMLLVATARDSVAYEYSGKSNRDGETYVKTHWGHTEVAVCCSWTSSCLPGMAWERHDAMTLPTALPDNTLLQVPDLALMKKLYAGVAGSLCPNDCGFAA